LKNHRPDHRLKLLLLAVLLGASAASDVNDPLLLATVPFCERDFRSAFSEDTPPVSGIGMAMDTDSTGTFATAFLAIFLIINMQLMNGPPLLP
jgi:hypothetical protein